MNKHIEKQVQNIIELKDTKNEKMFRDYLKFVLIHAYHVGVIDGIKKAKKLLKHI